MIYIYTYIYISLSLSFIVLIYQIIIVHEQSIYRSPQVLPVLHQGHHCLRAPGLQTFQVAAQVAVALPRTGADGLGNDNGPSAATKTTWKRGDLCILYGFAKSYIGFVKICDGICYGFTWAYLCCFFLIYVDCSLSFRI